MLSSRPTRTHLITTAISLLVVLALSVSGLAVPNAEAAGPEYSGPVTQATGPAFFGPAPNAFPYCENPTYFDPFPENVDPIGRIDPTGSPNAEVETNGLTMTFELTAEGSPDSQYPGFFPAPDGEGSEGDQPKGVEMASDDEAQIRLSEPLFYTQWVFTDVDRANEGFIVTPLWNGNNGQIAVFGGDANFSYDVSSTDSVSFNDIDTVGHDSEAIEGRVQVDMLGAVTGIDLVRDTGSGQSGFAIGGGCEPLGAAKELTSGPTWNGSSFDVTYTIRVRNNLPSGETLAADIDQVLSAAAGGEVTGTPEGIELSLITLTDLLANDAFSEIIVVSNENTSGNIAINPDYDGIDNLGLVADGETIPAETEEEFVLTLQYVPAEEAELGPDCNAPYVLENQAFVGGVADGIDLEDASDDGTNPDPGDNNGNGEVDDPTIVEFECPPVAPPGAPVLEIVKTVLAGADAACGGFDDGVAGEGDALEVEPGDTVTYCIAVRNSGESDATDVVISDDQAPGDFDGDIGTLAAGAEDSRQYNVTVEEGGPTTNVAAANGNGPDGEPLPEADDPAVIDIPTTPPPPGSPVLEIVKTALLGPAAECGSFDDGIAGEGTAIDVEIGDTVTYCISVRNSGESAATDVVISDDQAPGDFDGDIGTLAAGAEESRSYDVLVGVDTPDMNIAGAQGLGPDGEPLPEVEDPAVINPPAPGPAVTLTKTVLAGADADCTTAVEGDDEFFVGLAGDAITWCFVATNTGNVPLTNVVFTDGPAGIADLDLLEAAGLTVLLEGQALAFSEPGTIPENGVDNVASVTGLASDPDGNPIDGVDPVEDENTAAINEAGLQLSKTVLAGADADCASAVEEVTVNVGSEVTYCFTVSNTGGVPMRVTEVVDSTLGVTIPISSNDQVLAPGDEVTVSHSTTALDDIVNIATVEGVPIDTTTGEPIPGAPVFNPEDPAGVDTLEANLSIVKSNNGFQRSLAGNIITYTLVIANAGPDAAEDVVVVDTLPEGLNLVALPDVAGWSCADDGQVITCERAEPLEADDSDTLTYRVQVATTAPAGEALVNTVTVKSSTPDPDPSDNEDEEETIRVIPPGASPPPIVEITVPEEEPPPAPPLAAPPLAAPPLAVTGSSSGWLAFTSAAMTAAGGVLLITSRRRRDDLLDF